MFQVCLRYNSGISQAYLRHMISKSQAYSIYIFGLCLGSLVDIFWKSRVYLEKISDISQIYSGYLSHFFQVYVICKSQVNLGYCSGISQVYLKYILTYLIYLLCMRHIPRISAIFQIIGILQFF